MRSSDGWTHVDRPPVQQIGETMTAEPGMSQAQYLNIAFISSHEQRIHHKQRRQQQGRHLYDPAVNLGNNE